MEEPRGLRNQIADIIDNRLNDPVKSETFVPLVTDFERVVDLTNSLPEDATQSRAEAIDTARNRLLSELKKDGVTHHLAQRAVARVERIASMPHGIEGLMH